MKRVLLSAIATVAFANAGVAEGPTVSYNTVNMNVGHTFVEMKQRQRYGTEVIPDFTTGEGFSRELFCSSEKNRKTCLVLKRKGLNLVTEY